MHLPVHGAQQLPTLPRITIANIPIEEVTTKDLRLWRRDNDNFHTSADLQRRKIGSFCQIPDQVWKIIHHPIKPFHIQELHYKMIYNALPLASRTRFFTNSDQCYACSEQQDMEHFISSCWTAQTIWSYLKQLDTQLHGTSDWPVNISDHFFGVCSLSESTVVSERRILLHGTVLETLWLAFTGWFFGNKEPSKNGIINLFKTRLVRILGVFQEKAKVKLLLEDFHDKWYFIYNYVNSN